MLVTRPFLVTIDFTVKKIRLRKSLVIINCLVTNIVQKNNNNTILCSIEKEKKTHTDARLSSPGLSSSIPECSS